jgi:WD40 repeat protein
MLAFAGSALAQGTVAAPPSGRTDLYGDPLPDGALARMGTVRLRHHSSSGLPAVISPDGTVIVTGNYDSLRFWEGSSGKLLREIKQIKQLGRFLFAPRLQWFAMGTEGNTVLLDPSTGQLGKRLAEAGEPFAVSPNGRILVTGISQGAVLLWDTSNAKQIFRLEGHEKALIYAAFTRDGGTLVTFGWDKKLCRWKVADGKLQNSMALPLPLWRTVRLSPDARTLAVIPYSREAVQLWDTETGRPRIELQGRPACARYGLAFTPDCQTLITDWLEADPSGENAGKATFSLWDAVTGKLTRRFPVPTSAVGQLQFMPDGRTVLSSAGGPLVQLWDTQTGLPALRRPAHERGITSLCFTADGRTLISASESIRLWETASGRPQGVLAENTWPTDGGLHLQADGKTVLAPHSDGGLCLWDTANGRELRRLTAEDKPGVPRKKACRIIASACDRRTAVGYSGRAHAPGDRGPHSVFDTWNMDTGKVLCSRPAEVDHLIFLLFSPDGTSYATYDSTFTGGGPLKPGGRGIMQPISGTSHVLVKETTTARRLVALPQPEQYGHVQAFSPDGRTLVTATFRMTVKGGENRFDQHTLHFWELATGKERQTIACPDAGYPSRFARIAFAPGGRTLATARGDHVIQLWDVTMGMEILRRTGYDADADCLAFAPDGKALASGHRDTTILLWDIAEASPHPQRVPAPVDEQTVEAWWADLKNDDAQKAYAASWKLVAAPTEAVRTLRKHLAAATGVPPDQLRQLLEDLDSSQFARRKAASQALSDFEELAYPALAAALQANPSVEKRQRIEALLGAPRIVHSPGRLQAVRAVEVLEYIGTPAAREVLATLARGAPEARLTQEAKASLDRLSGLGRVAR